MDLQGFISSIGEQIRTRFGGLSFYDVSKGGRKLEWLWKMEMHIHPKAKYKNYYFNAPLRSQLVFT